MTTMQRPIWTTYNIGNCPLHPLYDAKTNTVDRNRVPSLAMCRLCQYYKGEDDLDIECGWEPGESPVEKPTSNEKDLKDQILNIMYTMECDDPAHAIEDNDLDRAANSIILLISAMLRQERLSK